MKMKKIISCVAAMAMAVSMMAVNASATNWANASYADKDPNTVKIISTDENKVTFTATADGAQAKCRVLAGDLLAEEDLAKVKSASWTVSYDVSQSKDFPWLGGGTYFAFKNSDSIDMSEFTAYEEDAAVGYTDAVISKQDQVKFLLPTEVLAADSEIVFIDWSSSNLVSNNVTISISDLKFFDADGNEVAQKAYEGAATTEEAVPAADAETTSTATGNTAAAVMVSVMAVAAVAAVATKKRK